MNTKTIGAIIAALVIIVGGAIALGLSGGDDKATTGTEEASIQPAAADATAEADKGLDGIVVVDVQRLESVSKAAKSLESQLKAKRDAFQKELAAEEKSLRAEREAIVKDQNKMSKDELEKKAKAFEQKLA
ncbi:MAG: OmpH family outer membrane protein, partial [Pseudobdellovibrionaceae bacterium]